jgi:NTE family protein
MDFNCISTLSKLKYVSIIDMDTYIKNKPKNIEIQTSPKIIKTKTDVRCKNLVIGGGGNLVYAYVGVIEQMFNDDDLIQIENCVGTSAGAIIAMIISSNATIDYIKKIIIQFDMKKIADHSPWAIINIYNILNYFGYNKGDIALQWIENILEELTGDKNITFAEHYNKFKKNLVITGCNISRNTYRYFNRLTDPDMKVSNAVRISMSVPIFFKPFEYEGDLYIDGGTTLNYPISFVLSDMFKVLNNYRDDIIGPKYIGEKMNVDKAEHNLYDLDLDIKTNDVISKDYILERTIGMKTFNKRTLNYIKPDKKYDDYSNFNLYSYCNAVMSMLTDAAMREYIDEEMWLRTIKIDSTKFNSLDFNVTSDEINTMIELGKTSAKIFMDKFRINANYNNINSINASIE